MSRCRFDLKIVFIVMTNACVFAWGLMAMVNHSFLFLVVPVTTALSGALYSRMSGGGTVASAAICGAIGAAALPITCCVLHDIRYLFQITPSSEYFEDGTFFEVVIFPIAYLFTWGPLGALLGIFIGTVMATLAVVKKPAGFTN